MKTELEDVQGRSWTVEAGPPAEDGQPYFVTFRSGDAVYRREYAGEKAPSELSPDDLRELLHATF